MTWAAKARNHHNHDPIVGSLECGLATQQLDRSDVSTVDIEKMENQIVCEA